MTNVSRPFLQKFKAAQALQQQGRLQDAESAFQSLLKLNENTEIVLQSLVQVYLQSNRLQEAADCLESLIKEDPDQLFYYDNLANLESRLGHPERAIACYRRFLDRQPQSANAHFNLALLFRQNQRFEEALDAYRNALDNGIDGPEEVWSNMSLVYSDLRQEDKAREALETALRLNPHYAPAMFNLADLYEEAGDREAASAQFQEIIDHDPHHYHAMARLADVKTFDNSDDPLLVRLRQAAGVSGIDPAIRIDVHFALGKALNDCGAYDEAFEHYRQANAYARETMPAYDRARQETLIDQMIDTFSADWFDGIEPVSEASPIFICGMFRSGSTLFEQVLASHPAVTAGGEIDFFVRAVATTMAPFPGSMRRTTPDMLANMAETYLTDLRDRFSRATHITDKRPDNFLYLGLIKSLFPNARIIHTGRNPLDNCLSVYFMQLGRAMNYALNLDDAAHYYSQHIKLMNHWKTLFGQNIFEADYGLFVQDPEPVVRQLLDFCGLEWSDHCLEFHKTNNFVKTASVWQVRQPLYKSSSGRWRNYDAHIGSLKKAFPTSA